jgi:hypothetical protein
MSFEYIASSSMSPSENPDEKLHSPRKFEPFVVSYSAGQCRAMIPTWDAVPL